MNNAERENAFREVLGEEYNRLCTYYYPKSADIVITGEDNEKRRTVKRIKRSKTRDSK